MFIPKRILTAVLGLILVGCGSEAKDLPDLGSVSGVVKIDGEPTEDVIVTFAPVSGGRSSTGITDSSGYYELNFNSTTSGAIIGQHNVFISSNVEHDPNDPEAPMVPPAGNVPRDYQRIEKQAEVKAGDNEIDLSYP
ncbi:hypothetical protein Mal4_20210 [Maioricimonas rarisocia]|uniref:Carboxypeptidase regulatory-like domain-containing protein n=1 Tax=Maioricimonas rarisocia TaxID=2528026 RepID=A0A517Z5G6_9PLAN|nr:carboxypeptidase regulatory-like domain-containing protein [Maioricimonas rarisocia]QDU37705.1 hypothetical protein Mal4_20210 [Maioricimonas rarisocia]